MSPRTLVLSLAMLLTSIQFSLADEKNEAAIAGPELGTKVELFETDDLRGRFCHDTFL